MNAMQRVEQTADAIVAGEWTRERIDLVKRMYCNEASDDELALFLSVCRRTGLSPEAKQIYAIMRSRWNAQINGYEKVMSIQTGIDGFRLTAQRSNELNGQDGPFWCGPDGRWLDAWLEPTSPSASKITVYRKGCEHGFTAVARYDGYVETRKDGQPTKMWAKMPDLMIAKCAEALAIRKAFPQELSGLYTTDEMGQANNGAVLAPRGREPGGVRAAAVGQSAEPVVAPRTPAAPSPPSSPSSPVGTACPSCGAECTPAGDCPNPDCAGKQNHGHGPAPWDAPAAPWDAPVAPVAPVAEPDENEKIIRQWVEYAAGIAQQHGKPAVDVDRAVMAQLVQIRQGKLTVEQAVNDLKARCEALVQGAAPAPQAQQSPPPRQGEYPTLPSCPQCGQAAIIKNKFQGGWLCWEKQGGCGTKFASDPNA